MGFSRQEHRSGYPFPSPGDLPDPGIKRRSPALQADFFFFFFFTIWALSKVLSIKTCVASVIWDLCPLRSLQNLTLLLIPGSQLGELAAHPQTTKGLFSNFLLQWTWFPFRKPPVIKNIWKHKKAVCSPWGGKDGGGLLFIPEPPRFYCYFSQSQKLDFLVLSHRNNTKQIKI